MLGWNNVKFEYYPKQLLSNFEAKIMVLTQATEAEMKFELPIKTKTCTPLLIHSVKSVSPLNIPYYFEASTKFSPSFNFLWTKYIPMRESKEQNYLIS